jgi:hypothetical protein
MFEVNMEWLLCGGVAILAFFAGTALQRSTTRKANEPINQRIHKNLAQDRELALQTLRRELANYMIRCDPERYLKLYRRARDVETAIGAADKSAQEAQLSAITEKYPFYADFDFIGVRNHVLYADALSTSSYEDVENHFLNMIEFQALQHVLDDDWKRYPATSDRDLNHLEEYVRNIKDTKFKQRLEDAVREFSVYQRGVRDAGSKELIHTYATDVVTVRYVSHFAETRYGVHFKDTDEFGLYGLFYADDRDEPHLSLFRSDANFKAEIVLDHLRMDQPV